MFDPKKFGFTEGHLTNMQKMGSANLVLHMAEKDGYNVEKTASVEQNLISVFGQKLYEKKASLKKMHMGLRALRKLGI